MADKGIGTNALAREGAIRFAIIVDSFMLAALVLTALASGSLTILAETVRGSMMFTLELIAFFTMCRVHRGRFHGFDYGSGKVEQIANIGIAGGMLIGGFWIVLSALGNALSGGNFLSSFGLALAAVFAAVNLYVNAIAWYKVRLAARLERSVILEAQLQARWAKALTSVVVFLVLTLAVLAQDRLIVTWLDVIGALVVAYYMVGVSLNMLRESLIDVLDRSLDEAAQLKIIQALVDVSDDYDHYDGLRTRRAGNQVFIDVALGFDDKLTLGEVDLRRRRIEGRLKECVGGADVVVRVAGLRG